MNFVTPVKTMLQLPLKINALGSLILGTLFIIIIPLTIIIIGIIILLRRKHL